MKKFRPIDLPPRVAVKHRRIQGQLPHYNWVETNEWYPAHYQVNHRTISRQFYRLHYLACHAPRPVRQRWWHQYRRRSQQLFGTHAMSVHYSNTWSAGSWL